MWKTSDGPSTWPARAGASWRPCRPTVGATSCKKTADLIGAELESLTTLLTRENGKTVRQCRAELVTTQRLFVDFAEEAKRIRGNYLPMDGVPGLERMVAYTVRQPVGIVVGIIPFNYPAELFAHKIPGALAAGAAVIVKLPEQCPLTVLRIGELILQAGLPPEGMQMLTGFPQDLGDELVTSPDVRLISFTGSAGAAKIIAGKAANTLTRLAFELGGTDAMIVLEDADIDAAAEAVVQGRLTNGAGQICCAVKRVFVQETIREEFLELLLKRVSQIKMGDPSSEETDLGPLITPEAAAKADQQINESIAMGARCLAGGKRGAGSFYEPTILVDVTPDMPVMKDEVFAPVAPVCSFTDIESAIEMANDSLYGLQSTVFSSSISNALKIAHRLDVGRRGDQRSRGLPAGQRPVRRLQAERHRPREHRRHRARDDGRKDDRHQQRALVARSPAEHQPDRRRTWT